MRVLRSARWPCRAAWPSRLTPSSRSPDVHRVLVLAVVVLFGTQIPVHAASFDCAAAKSSVEKLICSDPALSDLDGRLGQAFQAARGPLDPKGREWLSKVQRSWLSARLGWCGIPAAGAEG